jgi:hypothetical protein
MENVINEMAENLKGFQANIEAKLEETKAEIKVVRDEAQKQFDAQAAATKKAAKREVKHLDEVIIEKLDGKLDEMEKSMKSNGKFRLDLRDVKSMTLSASLTGDAQASYALNASVLPSQAINFRDLIPTVRSESGLYVFYKETATTNNIAAQTEGSNKGENNYALSEVKVVNDYIAGFSTFSAAATGSTTTAETVDLKQLVDYIGNQKSANFVSSVALVSPAQLGRLLKETITAGYYAGSGSVIVNPNGGMTIWGTPVIAASWVTDDKVLILDNNFVERIEVEGMAIEFSYENASNFQQNMVTARIECYEDINLMQPTSAIYADLGNV